MKKCICLTYGVLSYALFLVTAIYAVAFFLALCLVLAALPASGRLKLGHNDEKPEFSNFSWFSMMFGAGLGVGLMVFATAEPLGLWGSNPVVLAGAVEARHIRARADAPPASPTCTNPS